jgi:hypothetical protein
MKKLLVAMTMLAATLCAQQAPVTITYAGNADAAYQAVLNRLKVDGFDIESASKDAGIQTVVVVTGKYRQTGTYLKITFIADDVQTTARIAVYEEKRYKALKTEPWSDPKVNEERSQAQAFRLKQELGW